MTVTLSSNSSGSLDHFQDWMLCAPYKSKAAFVLSSLARPASWDSSHEGQPSGGLLPGPGVHPLSGLLLRT